MRKIFKILSFFVLWGFVVAVNVYAYDLSTKQIWTEVSAIPSDWKPSYLVTTRQKIMITRDVDDPSVQIAEYQKGEVVASYRKHVVVSNQGNLNYLEFSPRGELVRTVELGLYTEELLATSRFMLVDNFQTVFGYILPYSGARVFVIDKSGKVDFKLYRIPEYLKLYVDNDVFLDHNKIVIPAGDLRYFSIDLDLQNVSERTLIPESCGDGEWGMDHNTQQFFILRTKSEVCVFDLNKSIAIRKMPIQGNVWFRLIPELNIMIVEKWSTSKGVPDSTGDLSIYDYISGDLIINLSLKGDANFQNLLDDSVGGLTIAADYHLNNGSVNLYTRGTTNRHLLQLSANYQIVRFSPVPNLNYSPFNRIGFY